MKPILEYTDISLPVPILQGDVEFRRLIELYKTIRPRSAVEIGSLFSGSLFFWITCAPPQATVISVDMNVGTEDSRFSAQIHGRNVLWPEWARKANVVLHTFVGPSNKLRNTIDSLLPMGIDFLFIDGDHSYAAVRADFDTYWDLVSPGGHIAFHDIYRRTQIDEVWKLWQEIKDLGHDCLEFSSIPAQDDWGIGVVRKRETIKLAVITPVSRPENLELIIPHMQRGFEVPGLTLTWYIIHDSVRVANPLSNCPPWIIEESYHRPGTAGKAQINHVLHNRLRNSQTLVWVLDDDNLPHPDFFLAIRNAAAYHPTAHGFAFAQELGPDIVCSVSPESMRECHIDQAQYIWNESERGNILIPECYNGDGMFVETLYTNYPDRWILMGRILSYYNRLRS